jgi:outer membrane lipoprotein SlyB
MSHLARATAVLLALVVLGAGCAHTQSPVLYPNAKLKEAGKDQANAEISACRSLADDYTSSGAATAKEIGKDTAVGGVGGAAVGATAGAVHGTAKSVGPSPIYKAFVDRCLRERGYEVIGWQ